MWDSDDWDLILERSILGVVLALVLWAALALGSVRATEFSMAAALAGVGLIMWIARFWLNEDHRLLLPPVVWALVAFMGYAVCRYLGTPVEYQARHEILQLAVYFVAFLLALHNLHKQDSIQFATAVLVVLGMCLSFYALVQLASGSDKVWWFLKPRNYDRRGGATFINPNHLAGLLVLIMPLAAAQVFVGRSKPVVKILYGYAALAMLAGIGVTMSRGGWVATAIALVALLGWLLRRRQHRIPALVMMAVIGTGAAYYFTQVKWAKWRLAGTFKEGTIDAGHSRAYLTEPAVRMWKDHLWTGVGPGQFDVVFPSYRSIAIQVAPDHVHNEFLECLVDYGLVGGGLILLALIGLGWGWWKTSRHVERGSSELGLKSSNRSAFFLGATVGILGLLAHSAVEFHRHIPGVALAGVVITGLLVSNVRFGTERFWLNPHWFGRIAITLAALGWFYWMVPRTWLAWREGRLLNRIAAAERVDDALIGDLTSAANLEPANPRTRFELGENLRQISWRGDSGYEAKAREAIQWLRSSIALNPRDARAQLSLAMCHHWIGEKEQAAKAFDLALEKGPNDVTVANHVAWNHLLRGNLPAARALLERSLQWNNYDNPMARHYLGQLILAEQKAGVAR